MALLTNLSGFATGKTNHANGSMLYRSVFLSTQKQAKMNEVYHVPHQPKSLIDLNTRIAEGRKRSVCWEQVRMRKYCIPSFHICPCGKITKMIASWTDINPRRKYTVCSQEVGSCGYWYWIDEEMCRRSVELIPDLPRGSMQQKSKERNLKL